MKRIIAILAVALAGLAACTKLDTAQLDGTYQSAARQEIVLAGGACVSYREADSGVLVTGFETTGRYPNFTYTAKGQPDVTQVGPVTGFTIQAHFTDADTFTASAAGIIVSADGTATGLNLEAMQFRRVSANSKQTKN
jgi:hypothetical protein